MRQIVRYVTVDTCGNTSERGAMNNTLSFDILSLRPNPAPKQNGGAHAVLQIALGTASEVSVKVRDMLGREYAPWNGSLERGNQSIELNLSGTAEGTYFVTIEVSNASGRSRQSRKLLIHAE